MLSTLRSLTHNSTPFARSPTTDEENIPAEQPSAQENSRLPGPHEEQERTDRSEASACQGEEEAHGVIHPGRRQRFRPDDRMRKKADFDRAYSSGRRLPSASFMIITCPAGMDRPRLGITVPKTVGGAVVRNAVRRRLREAFRKNREAIAEPLDIVIHVRPGAAGASFADLERELIMALRRLGSRRGTGD